MKPLDICKKEIQKILSEKIMLISIKASSVNTLNYKILSINYMLGSEQYFIIDEQ